MSMIVADVNKMEETARMYQSASNRFRENFVEVISAMDKLYQGSNGSKALEAQLNKVKEIQNKLVDSACNSMVSVANLLNENAEEIKEIDRAD